MIQISKNEKEKVLEAIKKGKIDAADISLPNLIDSILLAMHKKGVTQLLAQAIPDKRADNLHIPFDILLTLGAAAKLKQKTSLTDIPYAVLDSGLLSVLGWNVSDPDRPLEQGLFSESVMRKLLLKYDAQEWIRFYNTYTQEYVLPSLSLSPVIHMLDCTKIPVNLKNKNYENSGIVKIDGETFRGYKLGVLRGVTDVSGVAEEICFGSIQTHDLELCRDMLINTPCFQEGDILINDRGFLSRPIVNLLKNVRKVDSYVPARKGMAIYEDAVMIASREGKWQKHPNKKRKTQKIQLVKDLGNLWLEDGTENRDPEGKNVPLNACVVRDEQDGEYYVFLTTDTTKTARQIIQVYETRPEIEEDFRQMKDFWKLEDFKSTKYNYIAFHIVMTLVGYLYFQIYKNMEEGSKYIGKSLPVAAKNYRSDKPKDVIIYSGQYFGIFTFLEFIQLYAGCPPEVRSLLDPILVKV